MGFKGYPFISEFFREFWKGEYCKEELLHRDWIDR
jgi:hypothetical protein